MLINRDRRQQWIRWRQRALIPLGLSNKLLNKLLFFGIMLLTVLGLTLRPAISVDAVVGTDTYRATTNQTNSLSLTLPQYLATNIHSPLPSEGQRQYESGQIATALQSWQQAAAELSDQPLHQALIFSYVSIAAQDLGDWTLADSAIAHSLSLLAENPAAEGRTRVQAQVLNAQGRLYLKRGQPETAWEIWQQAESAYAESDDWLGRVGAQINQSQALQTMGLYRRARLQLTEITTELDSQSDSAIKAIALKSLGNVFQTVGSLEQSRQYLSESLVLYQQMGSKAEVADTLLSLANTLRLMQDYSAAQQRYQQVETLLPGSVFSTKAKLNRFSLLLETQKWQPARVLLPELLSTVKAMPASRESIYSKVNLVESLLSDASEDHRQTSWLPIDEMAALLREGTEQAQTLQDKRAESIALGALSKLYGYTQQWLASQNLAKRALDLAQASNAQDIAYRWQHQLGKAYYQQGKAEEAIASYTEAVETLGTVRRDLLATNADIQFSFKETVEPVYRELVSLLLLADEASEKSLSQAREVVEALQLAELENYFKSACIDSASEYIDKLDSTAAILYPIVLSDRVEVILSLPGLPLRHYRTWQTEQVTNQTLSELFQYFNPVLSQSKRLRLSKQVYDWLITPAEAALSENSINTLVFVLDGQFRRVPMAALHDGQQYLLEKYSVALTPGLKLLGPHFQNPKPLQALMLGLTEARAGFSALPGVQEEIEQVSASINAEVLFNEDFTKQTLATEISRIPFPVLHLATHGQFSSNLDETFLLAWDQKLTLADLDGLLRARRQQSEPIELMVLSACQTAEGDDRATLGLAGMAIRSGARSTLATLWAVNDESTAVLMAEFYKELSNTELSKAEALRFAQIKILKNPEFSHPFYWAPFVLIGNWLS
ncbi:MAG: CHAT domain-containing protein [Phormidesmis sp. RL_2_1]|nr:CHAT domain-containing protein [Phormidesmis sp. RL_2_1]